MAEGTRRQNYLNNENLIREILRSQERQKQYPNKKPAECLTPDLVNMLMLLVERYSQKWNWRNYTYLTDMKSEALVSLCQNALKFDITKSNNPFGYYTQIITHAFITTLDKEKKQRDIKDSVIILTPDTELETSLAHQMENESNQLGLNLDGTKRVAPLRGRRPKPILPPRDEIPSIDNEPKEDLSDVGDSDNEE